MKLQAFAVLTGALERQLLDVLQPPRAPAPAAVEPTQQGNAAAPAAGQEQPQQPAQQGNAAPAAAPSTSQDAAQQAASGSAGASAQQQQQQLPLQQQGSAATAAAAEPAAPVVPAARPPSLAESARGLAQILSSGAADAGLGGNRVTSAMMQNAMESALAAARQVQSFC